MPAALRGGRTTFNRKRMMSETGYASRDQCEAFLKIIYGEKRNCCRCEFFSPFEPATSSGGAAEQEGWCQRYPPSRWEEDLDRSLQPNVTANDWCGEFVEGKQLTVDDIYAYWLDDAAKPDR